jgi:hypothetical protein
MRSANKVIDRKRREETVPIETKRRRRVPAAAVALAWAPCAGAFAADLADRRSMGVEIDFHR